MNAKIQAEAIQAIQGLSENELAAELVKELPAREEMSRFHRFWSCWHPCYEYSYYQPCYEYYQPCYDYCSPCDF